MKLVKFIPMPGLNPGLKSPTPSKTQIPEWYTKAERYYSSPHGEQFSGLKTCAPFLDGLLAGYMLVTPEDIYVSYAEDGALKLEWESDYGIVGERKGVSGSTMPRPAGHENNHLVWSGQWGWKTPKGYSSLVVHPLNRFELPFTTMSAIVDTDEYSAWGNIPFFIKSGFTGVIPAGTPYAQIIPIKRDTWIYAQDWTASEKVVQQSEKTRAGDGVYKKLWRRIKDYS